MANYTYSETVISAVNFMYIEFTGIQLQKVINFNLFL